MAEHDHTTHVTGCYRCEIGRDEVAEQSARDVIAATLLAEGGAPGNSLHSWRCEYPDRYGPCDCVPATAVVVLDDLADAGYSVVKVPDRSDVRALLVRHRIVATSKADRLMACACDPRQWRPDYMAHVADAVLALLREATDG